MTRLESIQRFIQADSPEQTMHAAPSVGRSVHLLGRFMSLVMIDRPVPISAMPSKERPFATQAPMRGLRRPDGAPLGTQADALPRTGACGLGGRIAAAMAPIKISQSRVCGRKKAAAAPLSNLSPFQK